MDDDLKQLYDKMMACFEKIKVIKEEVKRLEAKKDTMDPEKYAKRLAKIEYHMTRLNEEKDQIGQEIESLQPVDDHI